MTPDEFYACYDKRVHAYARRTVKSFKLPRHMVSDLHQACYLGIIRQLERWDPEYGRSAFNWCAPKMRQSMLAEIRRYFSNKPYSWRREITFFVYPLGDREAADPRHIDHALRIDLRRAVAQTRNPAQTHRFIRAALDPNSGEDVACEADRSRQAINYAVRLARKRLQKTCHEYENYYPVTEQVTLAGVYDD